MISAEQVEKAARELWKLDVDRGLAPVGIDYEQPRALDTMTQRETYERSVVTVLRHVGVEFEMPAAQLAHKMPGGCAPGYCRAVMTGCPAGLCKAIC